ncbi:MAG: response regulator [Planctomycetaceae bacterium]
MKSSHQRVLLIDSERAFADLLAEKLNQQPDFEVLGVINDGNYAVPRILFSFPELIILDADLEGRNVFEIIKETSSKLVRSKFVILTNNRSDLTIQQARLFRLSGFMTKRESIDAILSGLRRVCLGGTSFSQEIAERMQSLNGRSDSTGQSISTLTARQIEVLKHLAQGQSVKEVAANMNLSEKSVDSHKYRIMRRLDIHDRVKLALFAVREGLVHP